MQLEIMPLPHEYKFKNDSFILDYDSKIIIDSKVSWEINESIKFFQRRYLEETNLNIKTIRGKSDRFTGIQLQNDTSVEDDAYILEVDTKSINIKASSKNGFHYGLMTLIQLIKQYGLIIPGLLIRDQAHFKHRGFYHDVTRGKVPKKETIFEIIDLLSEYKINEFQLYIEHTFLWEGFSEVFRSKDAFSAEDILEIDDYAYKRNIELIPSIATFGHMYEILESQSFRHLSEKEIDDSIPFSFVNRMAHHTIDVSQEESIELVRHMIESFIPLFRSNKFNICGDETFDLGKYKNKELAKKKGTGHLYVDFLKQVIDIVQDNDRQVLFWGDIILKYPELLNEIPKDVICLNWGYMSNQDEENTRIVSESLIPQYVCPSTTGWNRMINWLDNSSENIRNMVKHAVKYDAYGILNTDWGDHGHVNLLSSSIPMIIYAAALSWNPSSMNGDETDDVLISKSYYGKENKDLLDLLRRISRHQIANWSYINFHLEKNYANPEVIEPFFEIMKALDSKAIYNSYFELKELRKELITYATTLDARHRQDFKEFMVMTSLMSLTQEAFIYMMHFDMGVEVHGFTREANLIAEDIEYVIEDYRELWRARNKESELFRVCNKFYEMADRLRQYERKVKVS